MAHRQDFSVRSCWRGLNASTAYSKDQISTYRLDRLDRILSPQRTSALLQPEKCCQPDHRQSQHTAFPQGYRPLDPVRFSACSTCGCQDRTCTHHHCTQAQWRNYCQQPHHRDRFYGRWSPTQALGKLAREEGVFPKYVGYSSYCLPDRKFRFGTTRPDKTPPCRAVGHKPSLRPLSSPVRRY